MKIAFLLPDITGGGGIERVTANLVASLNNHEISVLSLFKNREKPTFDIENVEITTICNDSYSSNFPPHRELCN